MCVGARKWLCAAWSLLLLLSGWAGVIPANKAWATDSEFIIDNGDPGFHNSGFSTNTSLTGYNGSSTLLTGNFGNYVTWTPSQTSWFTPGDYTVSVYLVQRPSSNAAAAVEVHPDGASYSRNIDIGGLNGSGFVELGTFRFSGALSEYVKLSKQSGSTGNVHADAVKFVKVPSDSRTNANLANLTVGLNGALNPAFSPTVTSYTYMVEQDQTEITLTPTAEDEAATVYINAEQVDSGTPSAPIALSEGSNTVTAVVYAEDLSFVKTYTVEVIRPSGEQVVMENEAYTLSEQADYSLWIEQKGTGASAVFKPEFTVLYQDASPKKGTGKLSGAPWNSGNGNLNYTVLAWNGNTDFSKAPGTRVVHTAIDSVFADGTLYWTLTDGNGYTLQASVTLPSGDGEPRLAYTLNPGVERYYTVGFTGAPEIQPSTADWIYQPLVWQGKRMPDKAYMTDESRSTLPLVMFGAAGHSVGVIADPSEMPFRLSTMANSRFGLSLRNDEGNLSPAIYAPIYGGEGSYRATPFTFSMRLFVRDEDSFETYKYMARHLYAFDGNRENSLTTLNETLENLADFILNSSGQNYSYWRENEKAYEYVNDKPGYGRQQSAVDALSLATVLDSMPMYEQRARPTIEYMASRQTQYMKLDGYDPAYPMGGPVNRYFEDWSALYAMSGERSYAFKQLFEQGYEKWAKELGLSGELADVIDHTAQYSREEALDHAKDWLLTLISAYRMTGEPAYLQDAVKVADDYIAWRLDQEPIDYYDARSSFYTDVAPMYYALYEMYEVTNDTKYADAFVASMRQLAQFIQLSPIVPSGNITVSGESVPAWRVSEIGLTSEASGTSHSHRAIFMPYFSEYFSLAAAYSGDDFFRDIAKSSIIGRYANYPGYTMRNNYSTVFEKPDYPLQWYSGYSNTAHMNHPLPMAVMIVDYLVGDVYDRSNRNISFPSRYSDTGAYFKNKVYGDRPGSFYGDDQVWLWLPKGLIATSSKQINYIAGYGNDKLYLALSNQSDEDLTVTVQLNDQQVAYGAASDARVWEDNAAKDSIAVNNGQFVVQVKAGGLTAVAIDNVQAHTDFQSKLQESGGGVQLHEDSFIQTCEPFGGMTGMIISLSPSLTSAYVYSDAGTDTASGMTLHYSIDDGAWQGQAKAGYPFEFTVPLAEDATTFKYYITDSKGRSSSEQSLWASATSEPSPRQEGAPGIAGCQVDPGDPGDPGEPNDPGDSGDDEAHATLVFADDYEDGNADGWTVQKGDWSIEAEDGNSLFKLPAKSAVQLEGQLQAGETTWSDYIVEARVKAYSNGVSGYASGIAARMLDANNMYLFRLHWSLNNAQLLKKVDGVWTTLGSSESMPLALNQWYRLKLKVQGDRLAGYVDGIKVIDYTDNTLPAGAIGVRTYNQVSAFDDFKVWQLPKYATLFDDSFEDGLTDHWVIESGDWSVDAEDTSLALKQHATTGEAIAHSGESSWTDYAVAADFKYLNESTIISSGLLARYGDADNYYFLRLFSDTSKIQLLKKVNGTASVLGEASAVVNAGTWYRLKLETIGDRINVYMDGTRQISVTDGSLSQGKIGLLAQGEQIAVDRVKVTTLIVPLDLVTAYVDGGDLKLVFNQPIDGDAADLDLSGLTVDGVAVQGPYTVEGHTLTVKLPQDAAGHVLRYEDEEPGRIQVANNPYSQLKDIDGLDLGENRSYMNPDAKLGDDDLGMKNGERAIVFSPAFDAESPQGYRANVPYSVRNVRLDPIPANPAGTIRKVTLNGEEAADVNDLPLKAGVNTIHIDIYDENRPELLLGRYEFVIVRSGNEDEDASAPQAPGKEMIEVDVVIGGDTGADIVKVEIERTTEPDGRIIDQVSLTPEKAMELAEKAAKAGESIARIVIPDPEDSVSEVKVDVSKETLQILKDNGIDLEIDNDNAVIQLPRSSMEGLEEAFYFRLVPIKDPDERNEVGERARTGEIVREMAGDRTINVVTRPMTIETNLSGRPVTLILPLRDVKLPSDVEERDRFLSKLSIFIEHTDGEKELVQGEQVTMNNGEIGLQFSITKFSTFTIVHADIPDGSHDNYINGYPDGTFRPEKSLTRAELAAILVNLGAAGTTQGEGYPDVPAAHWAASAVKRVQAAGLMQGYPDGTFRPEQSLTRAEMAAFAYQYLQLSDGASGGLYPDVEDSHWAHDFIAALSQGGWMSGYPDGTFRPGKELSRAEAVTMINRLFKRGPLYGISSSAGWPDVPLSYWAFRDIMEASHDHAYHIRPEGGETADQPE